MYKFTFLVVAALAGAAVMTPVLAGEESPAREQEQIQQQEQVRGRDLMSPEERAQHREKMRSLKTEEERKAFREEQHKKMQERAKEKGLTLPDQPGQGPPGMGGGRQGRAGPPR
ncbi:hypothetical protein [Methylococcus sp. Mc7]|uniref:hypothetical protein n=1 Tax=Methylococcus sp. Mc7 TaxID=2860258 RepID=UPI001C5277BB|nr:hypothetical protein [Methylococcus sp. Mc7]QXP83904.1 hypothetical protein KW115_17510 [Methylococcus sp. Mc7]